LGGVSVGAQHAAPLPVPLNAAADASPVRCLDAEAEREIITRIDAAKAAGDTLGGVVEVIALGVPVGLGSDVSWDRKLDGRLAQAQGGRSAVTAVPAMGVIAEAMMALVLAQALLEKFGGDALSETKRNFEGYLAQVRARIPRGAAS